MLRVGSCFASESQLSQQLFGDGAPLEDSNQSGSEVRQSTVMLASLAAHVQVLGSVLDEMCRAHEDCLQYGVEGVNAATEQLRAVLPDNTASAGAPWHLRRLSRSTDSIVNLDTSIETDFSQTQTQMQTQTPKPEPELKQEPEPKDSRVTTKICSWIRRSATELFSAEPTVIEAISEWSKAGRIAFLVGGYATLQNKALNAIYMACFVLSFTMCFTSCTVNLFMQMPPFHSYQVDVLITYIHLVGLHTWFFWRVHARDPGIQRIVRILKNENGDRPEFAKLRSTTRLILGFLLVAQVVVTVIIILGSCAPSLEHGLSGNDTRDRRRISFAHSVLMMLVIPQHVPTIVVGQLLFFVVNRLHSLDIQGIGVRAIDKMDLDTAHPTMSRSKGDRRTGGDNSQKEGLTMAAATKCVELIIEEAELAQNALDGTCRSWSVLWIHQLVFAFLEILVVLGNVRHMLSESSVDKALEPWKEVGSFAFMHLVFHAVMGFAVLFAALVTAASTTSACVLAPKKLLTVMRNRGASIITSQAAANFLMMRLRGFMVGEISVSYVLVSKFLSMLAIASGILLTTSRATGEYGC